MGGKKILKLSGHVYQHCNSYKFPCLKLHQGTVLQIPGSFGMKEVTSFSSWLCGGMLSVFFPPTRGFLDNSSFLLSNFEGGDLSHCFSYSQLLYSFQNPALYSAGNTEPTTQLRGPMILLSFKFNLLCILIKIVASQA